MRKSLSYKILAALMAAGSFGLYAATPAAADGVTLANNNTILCANGNDVVINGNELTSPVMTDKPNLSNVSEVYGIGYKYGNTNFTNTAYDGNVEINGSTFGWVYGGFTSGENATANNNTVTLNGSNINYIYGGQSISGSADTNTVTITGGNYGTVTGGDANSDKAVGTANNNNISIRGNAVINDCIMGGIGYTANKNTVTIKNSTVNLSKNINDPYYGLTGGVGYEGGAQYNQVIITNSTISGNVYGAYIYDSNSKAANDNSITVTGKSDITNAYLYGYGTNSDATGSNNALTLNGWSGSTKSVQNFNSINFDNINWQNVRTVLKITAGAKNDLANTEIYLNSIAGGSKIAIGDTMTLIESTNNVDLGIKKDNVNVSDKFFAGVATEGTGTATVNDDGSVDFTVDTLKANSQIDFVAENRAVAAAFVNQGTDLISDSLDTISRDDNYGVKTFAAVHGNRSKYDVNSDIKINGWSVIAGVGNADKFDNDSEFSWGVFYENGSGNYRTYNEFNNEFFRGDGSLVYNGGGIAARYTNKNGVYTEGSLRVGMLKSDMDNALCDGAGNFYSYESESAYYGAHIGVGKIISLSESSDLDVYGKFFHTYTEGDSFKVANDEFEFDSINSDRLRIGARITSNKENKFSTYYGLAYEYEFNGDADMTAQGLKAPTQSLQGSSVMAEVGFNYQPTPTSPWSFDLNMRGYTGERQGGSFNVQATYTF